MWSPTSLPPSSTVWFEWGTGDWGTREEEEEEVKGEVVVGVAVLLGKRETPEEEKKEVSGII